MAPVESLDVTFSTKVQTFPNFSRPTRKSPQMHIRQKSRYWQSPQCQHLSCHLSISLLMQKPQTANDDGLLLQLVQLYKLRITIFHNIENLWMVAISPGRMHTRRICNPNSIGIAIFWHLESSISYCGIDLCSLKWDQNEKKKFSIPATACTSWARNHSVSARYIAARGRISE